MSSNTYHIITEWRVKGTVNEVADLLKEATELPRWWPSVYIDVQEIKPGNENRVGRVVSLYTKGWLPYTIRWNFHVTESSYPYGFALEAQGDLVGRGIGTLKQDGEWVHVTYDWNINAERPPFSNLFLHSEARVCRQSSLDDAHGRRKPKIRAPAPSRKIA